MYELSILKPAVKIIVEETAKKEGMRGVDDKAPDFLIQLAEANRGYYSEVEGLEVPTERRGLFEALISTRNLTIDACLIAKTRRIEIVGVKEFFDALNFRFCNFWPFCRPTSTEERDGENKGQS